jgi:sterol desaturase/sphingolipid hydroxylase (fatty acid hydroxylase superfamily)
VFGHPHGAKSVNADLNVTLFFRFWDRLMGTELPSYERVFRAAPGPRAEAREPRGAVQSAP